MKGIILAGGEGQRLKPLTTSVIKQLLPVYDKPMIYYSLSVLLLAGIKDIQIISTKDAVVQIKKLLGDGKRLGVNFSYAVQEKPSGIAEAFLISSEFIGNDSVALVLGDNLFYGQGFTSVLHKVKALIENNQNEAVIFGYPVQDPVSYGVIEFSNGKVKKIVEKPRKILSKYAVPGLYFYNSRVVQIARKIKPSRRGELEITDVNNEYIKRGTLHAELLGRGLTWFDTGTCDKLLEASNYICAIQKRQGMLVSCIEEIAFNNGWIDRKSLLDFSKEYKTDYGKYLLLLYENSGKVEKR